MALKKLGQILIDLGLIDETQLATMLEEQASRGGELIGRVGVSLGFFTDEQLGEALAEQWNTTFVTLYDREIKPEVLRLVSEPMAQLYRVIPLTLEGDKLTVASAEPQKMQIADEIRTFLGYDVHIVVATTPRAWNRSSTISSTTQPSPPRPRPSARRGRQTSPALRPSPKAPLCASS